MSSKKNCYTNRQNQCHQTHALGNELGIWNWGQRSHLIQAGEEEASGRGRQDPRCTGSCEFRWLQGKEEVRGKGRDTNSRDKQGPGHHGKFPLAPTPMFVFMGSTNVTSYLMGPILGAKTVLLIKAKNMCGSN